MIEKKKGHGKQFDPPVGGKFASSTQVVTLTSKTYKLHFSHMTVKIMTLIDKTRQAF